jgi:hypothetical protein
MAIKNTVVIPMNNGMEIPANNVIVTSVHFPKAEPQYDESGVYTEVVRIITYDLFPYKTEADVTTEGVSFIQGEMVGVPSGWSKTMSPSEYAAILADGTLAEVWLKAQLNIWLAGNAASVVDPY